MKHLTRHHSSTPTTAAATALAVLAIGALAQHVHAQAVFVAQQRSVSASAQTCNEVVPGDPPFCDDDEDDAAAVGFLDFEAQVDVAVGGSYTGTGHAAQKSSLGTAEILAWGEVLASGESGACPFGNAGGAAESLFKTTFDLALPTAYRLNGHVARFGGQAAFVRLTGPGGLDLMLAATGPSPLPIDTSGTLVPGTYELSAEATTTTSGDGSSGAGFSARLAFGPSGPSMPASVTLVSQSRSVEWFEVSCNPNFGCNEQSGSQSAPAFGDFNATVGSASQSSAILPTSFEASGAVTPSVFAITKGGGDASETSTSSFSVTFEVEATVRARVRAAVAGGATFTFVPIGPPLGPGVFDVVDELVILAPGIYSAEAIASSSISAPFCIDSDKDHEAFTLAVDFLEMLDGDLDSDGDVDGADLGLLIAAWGTQGPGDIDGNGVVDGADLGALLSEWGSQ